MSFQIFNNEMDEKALLIHSGYSVDYHFDQYEATLKLLNKKFKFNCELLVCQGSLTACGFSGAGTIEDLPESQFRNHFTQKCEDCYKRLLLRTNPFVKSYLKMSDYIKSNDNIIIDEIIADLSNPLSIDKLINLNFCEINIGSDIFQSIQRAIFMGNPKEIYLSKNSIATEFIKNGLRYALIFDRIFSKNKYKFVLSNETSYIDWGIPCKIALKHNIPVVHQFYSFCGPDNIIIKIHTNPESLNEMPFLFYNTIIKNEFFSMKNDTYYRFNYETTEKWKELNVKDGGNKKKLISEFFNSNKKNIVVYTHLCWDSSIAYGDNLYSTFEDWLTNTFRCALQNKNVNWIFRVHPEEKQGTVNVTFNTKNYLTELFSKSNPENIKLMYDVDLNSRELLPHIFAGITTNGCVSYELPAMGIPCILASRKGYAELDFTISPSSKEEYEKLLFAIEKIEPPTENQIMHARRCIGMFYNKENYINISGIFDKGNPPRFAKKKFSFKKQKRNLDMWIEQNIYNVDNIEVNRLNS